MYDVLIKNGFVVDGSGNAGYKADVAVTNGRIVSIAQEITAAGSALAGAAAREQIDATGKVVTPGFIDTHTHSDYTILADPRAISKVHQGVTTEIVGNCGLGMAPLASAEALETAHDDALRLGVRVDWTSIAGYLDRVEQTGSALNVVALVGFGSVRESVMGYSRGAASQEQVAAMRRLVEQGVEEGAYGLSSGLFYAPQSYASTHEITDVVKGLIPSGSLYITHIRDEGNYNVGLIASLEEAFHSATEAGVPLHVSHLQANGIAAWGYGTQLVDSIEKMQARGLRVTADVYPYSRCGGSITGSVMPRWALEGGRSATLKRLADASVRQQIASEIASTFSKRGGPELHTFSSFPPNPEYEGMTLAQVCEIMGEAPEQAVLTLLEKDNAAWVAAILNDSDVDAIMAASWSMIGSDGYAYALSGSVSGGKPHPRSFGTFARVLAEYVRKRGFLSIPKAVRKMTALPAETFGLTGRGYIKEDYHADIVVFDSQTVQDRATFEHPHQLPDGISHVLVNGQVVVRDGIHTGKLPGRALRHS